MNLAHVKKIIGFFLSFQRILVATNLFGRGMDIERVNIVFNYDMPEDTDTYLHRVARAGRFGTKGLAITFVSDETDAKVSCRNCLLRFQIYALVTVKHKLLSFVVASEHEILSFFLTTCPIPFLPGPERGAGPLRSGHHRAAGRNRPLVLHRGTLRLQLQERGGKRRTK